MVSPGIWVLWSHELPPEGARVEGRYDDGCANVMGRRCRRGCCFFTDIGDLLPPIWWRFPEPQSEGSP